MADRRRGNARFLKEPVKPREGAKTFVRLASRLGAGRGAAWGVVGLAAAGTAFGLSVPWLVGRLVDLTVPGAPTAPVLALILVGSLGAVYLADAAGGWVQGRLVGRWAQGLADDLRRDLHRAVARLPLADLDRRDQGDLLSRMANDIDTAASGLAQTAPGLASAALGVTGSLVLMVVLSPVLTLAALAAVPLVFLLTGVVSAQTRRRFRAQQAALGALNTHIEESVSGFLEVKLFGREAEAAATLAALNEDLRQKGYEAQVWAGLVMPFLNVIGNLGIAILAGVGGALGLAGAVSVGVLASFVGYSRQFLRPLNDLANGWNALQAALAGAERVFEVLEARPEAPDAPPLPGAEGSAAALRGGVVFDGVRFHYAADRPVLEGFSLEVPPGTKVALVGATGSGKTTVVHLLLRFYEPTGGTIFLDGRPLDAWPRAEVRRAFGVVLQDTWIFEGTVAENLAYGRPGAPRADLEAAAALANAHDFIVRLPQGYDTPLASGAPDLSQGQRQLLSIARAFAAQAPFLILDEATSNIDTRTEVLVQEALWRLMEGRTTFIVAHRLATVRRADLIVLLADGRVAEAGTHEALVAAGGRYAALYRASEG